LRFALSYCSLMVNPWPCMILYHQECNRHISHVNPYLITVSSAVNGVGNFFISNKTHNFKFLDSERTGRS
jgi:hypothetical protein